MEGYIIYWIMYEGLEISKGHVRESLLGCLLPFSPSTLGQILKLPHLKSPFASHLVF